MNSLATKTNPLTRIAAGLALAAAAIFGLAAPAAADTYPPAPGAAQLSAAAVAPGGSLLFSVNSGIFLAEEPVSLSITGWSAQSATLASIAMASASTTHALGEKTAEADGSLAPVSIKVPADARGEYTITATSPSVPEGVSASFTIAPADNASGALPPTGLDTGRMTGIWLAGGILALAGLGIYVIGSRRKLAKESD